MGVKIGPDEDQPKFELPPFTPIFHGLDEHLWNGKFTPTSHSVYCLLQRHCNWATGIYSGCAETLKNLYGGTANVKQVADALAHLRKNLMINYRVGTGKRGSYNILIHKHLVRLGTLKGFRLNAFADNSLHQPLYEWPNGGRPEHGVSTDGGWTVCRLSAEGVATEVVHHQEIQEFQSVRILEFRKREKKEQFSRDGGEAKPPATTDKFDFSPDAAAASDRGIPVMSPETQPSGQDSTSPAGTSVVPTDTPDAALTEPEQLASQLYTFLKKPKKDAKSLSAWSRELASLLTEHAFKDVAGTMEFGFTVDDFWPGKLFTSAGKDPCDYFIEKFPTILAKYRGRMQSKENAAKHKPQSKESTTHGKQTHSGKTGNAKTSGNENAVAETIEWLRKQQSGSE